MEFNSKTELQEHILELLRDGYLSEGGVTIHTEKGHTVFLKFYQIDFSKIPNQPNISQETTG